MSVFETAVLFTTVWLLVLIALADFRPVDWLIERAKRTPYWHLDGYMERYWLVPYSKVAKRKIEYLRAGYFNCPLEPLIVVRTDGTGPVTWRRPIARLLQHFDIAARVHHILRSDHGRDPHDHPWWFVSIILRGGYYEVRFDADGGSGEARWHGPGSILFRRATDLHKLMLPDGQTAWTLFITGKKCQTWGFKPEGRDKIPYHEYEGEA